MYFKVRVFNIKGILVDTIRKNILTNYYIILFVDKVGIRGVDYDMFYID